MGTLVISNQLPEETVRGPEALPPDYIAYLGAVSHRLLWLCGPGDVLVVPTEPDPAFVAHVQAALGLSGEAPAIVTPPPGEQGSDLLYDDRLDAPEFVAQLRRLAADMGIDRVLPFYLDSAVRRLLERTGLTSAVPGGAFLAEGGNEIVNSKSGFRAIAAGNGVPLAEGCSVRDAAAAEAFAVPLIERGIPVIIKRDQHGGGYGNELLTPDPAKAGFGVARVHVVTTTAEVHDHLLTCWDQYSHQQQRRVVLERYHVGARPLYSEFLLTEAEARLVGQGEMRTSDTSDGPTNTGLVIPSEVAAKLPSFPGYLAAAKRIAAAVHALGYRGTLSVDAVATTDGEIFFNEFNGRISGSTPVHVLTERLLGTSVDANRVLLVRSRRDWPSPAKALETLAGAGLAYDPQTQTGILVSGDDGQFVAFARSAEQAAALEVELVQALGLARS